MVNTETTIICCWKASESTGQHPNKLRVSFEQKIPNFQSRFPVKPQPQEERRVE